MKAASTTDRIGSELDAHYSKIEKRFGVRPNNDYERLVVPNGNGGESVHRWFRLKEAFSRRLLDRVRKDLNLESRRSLRVLDPFAGSGTTAVSIADLVGDGTLTSGYTVGYECNPFLHLVASTKLRALQQPSLSFLALAKRIAATAARDRVNPAAVPLLSTFTNKEYFAEQDLIRLLQLRAAIDEAEAHGADPLDADLARICLGASIEPVSSLRRDGRALRFVPDKARANPIAEFLRRAEEIDEDIPQRATPVRGRIQLGDGRTLTPRPPRNGSIDLILFSPPYPNNIDYTEIYKMEAWLLGYISNPSEFSDQRLRSLYSHPSIRREVDSIELPAEYARGFRRLLDPILEAVPSDRYCVARTSMIEGYARDMLLTLRSCRDSLADDGNLVYVVGNSAHGTQGDSVVIAADLLIASLANMVGFEITSIEVARQLNRRQIGSTFLRESVVFARPMRNK